jgi:hypothetical protein
MLGPPRDRTHKETKAMADEKEKAPEAATEEHHPHPAKVGVKDEGEEVTTGLGERVDGQIADIADGDRRR